MATSYLSESVEVDRKSVIASAYSLRCKMSQVLLDIASGSVKLSDLLKEDSVDTVDTVDTFDTFDTFDTVETFSAAIKRLYLVKALEAFQHVGKVKARRLMADLEITEKRRIESLTINERQALLEKFETFI
jgi:hypothetical protein